MNLTECNNFRVLESLGLCTYFRREEACHCATVPDATNRHWLLGANLPMCLLVPAPHAHLPLSHPVLECVGTPARLKIAIMIYIHSTTKTSHLLFVVSYCTLYVYRQVKDPYIAIRSSPLQLSPIGSLVCLGDCGRTAPAPRPVLRVASSRSHGCLLLGGKDE